MTTKRKPYVPKDPTRTYRERRVKFFTCKGTRHKKPYRAQSLKKHLAVTQLCRKCRKGLNVNPNQTSLFGMNVAIDQGREDGDITMVSVLRDGGFLDSVKIEKRPDGYAIIPSTPELLPAVRAAVESILERAKGDPEFTGPIYLPPGV